MSDKQKGAVSLFIVIFTTLLMTVLVVGFLRLMIQEQEQATNQDLSQSAYDSAVSGVEDAKRVLRACNNGDNNACAAISAQQCDTVSRAHITVQVGGNASSLTETTIKADGTTTTLNQGYTCVIINNQADDFLGNITDGNSMLVPLKVRAPGGVADTMKTITVEWMHYGQAYSGGGPSSLSQPTSSSLTSLPAHDAWDANAPALLRVEAVLPTDANTVATGALDTSTATTTFLRPGFVNGGSSTVNTVSLPTSRAAEDTVQTIATPHTVTCSNSEYQLGNYACKVTFNVPPVPTGSSVAFLRVTSLYRDTSFRITVNDSTGNKLQFDGVQPVVDATGRASNIFRRVSSRLDVASAILPPAAISITGDVCKDFYLTDTTTEAQPTVHDGYLTCDTKAP